MKLPSLLLATVFAAACSALSALAVPPTPDVIKKDLALVPATDPQTADAPELVSAMKGVHPRLLFTTQEIAALKASIPSDPVLQNAYAGVKQWAAMTLVPTGPNPLVVQDDQNALVKGLGQAPSMAYAYALDKDPAIKQKIVDTLTDMLAVPYWANVPELDNSMGAACNMFVVALLYDTVYNDLDPDLRAKLAQKIFTHARRMYYLGHKELSVGVIKYWQFDPQPNHRWYRDMGLAACLLSIADEKDIDSSYMMKSLKDEMDFVMKWYPPDGDCHEGAGYQNFGITPITTACVMMDRNLGTSYIKTSGLKNAWSQQVYYWVPGRLSDISWGDDQNGFAAFYSPNDDTFFFATHLNRDKDAQSALKMHMDKTVAFLATKSKPPGKPPVMPWSLLAFYDPTVGEGDYHKLPLYKIFPDMGAASMRDSWEDDGVVFTFKCGPYGGYKLNEYRNSTPDAQGNPHPINVAHDDPDANDFALAVGNGFAFHPGVYTESTDPKVVKLSQEHSTITIDGKGQVGEGFGFSQAVGNADMTKFSYLTGWKTDDKGHVIIEGEAGPAYRGQTGPELKAAGNRLAAPVLKTYRRTAIWMPKEYILILDNIQADGAHDIMWHGTTPQSQVADGQGTATTETGTPVGFQTVSDHPFDSKSVAMTLFGRFGDVPVNQIQYTLKSDAVRFATVLDPWKTTPKVKISSSGGTTTVTVHGGTFDDTWSWQDPKDATTPSSISGTRAGASLISLTDADKAPRG